MNILFEIINILCAVSVFVLKVFYMHTGTVALNTTAMVLICVFIAAQAVAARKSKLMLALFAFSFLAELFNLIYSGKSDVTMLFYFGMHVCMLVYLLMCRTRKKTKLWYELPVCAFILFIAYSWGFWRCNVDGVSNAPTYIGMFCYSLLLCVNLALSYDVNKKIFTGMLLVFLVDTIVVWSLVKLTGETASGEELPYAARFIRAICWLPFLIGEKLLREGSRAEAS